MITREDIARQGLLFNDILEYIHKACMNVYGINTKTESEEIDAATKIFIQQTKVKYVRLDENGLSTTINEIKF